MIRTIGQHAFELATSLPQDDAVARVTEALAAEGFGVITEIDMQATLRRKLGIETPACRILGACNPAFAHRATTLDPTVAVLMPCNVVVRDAGDHRLVTAMEPRIMAQVVANPELHALADDVSARLHAALERLA